MAQDIDPRLNAREARFNEQSSLASLRAGIVVTINLNLPGGHERYAWWPALLDKAVESVGAAVHGRGWRLAQSGLRQDAAGPYWRGVLQPPGSAGSVGSADGHQTACLSAKKMLAALEEGHPLGRLWDIDVLDEQGRPIPRSAIGLPERRCLICDAPAHECRVAGRHQLPGLVRAAEAIWCQPIIQEITRGAAAGILLEAATWPSPGLVNPRNSGAHTDMNYLTFLLSSAAVVPGLDAIAREGVEFALDRGEDAGLPALLSRVRAKGLDVERAMFRATSGVNTHRGAVFTMGIACAAAGVAWGRRALSGEPGRVQASEVGRVAAGITRGIVHDELEALSGQPRGEEHATVGSTGPAICTVTGPAPPMLSRGQRLYFETGCTGVRGELERGFPTVLEAGLPALEHALDKAGLADALVHALVAIMSRAEDSALATRHSLDTLKETVWPAVRDALSAGSVFTHAGRAKILEMDEVFAEKGINPGGSADLLAVTVAMYLWEHGVFRPEHVLKMGADWAREGD